jgi:hypothetical protein
MQLRFRAQDTGWASIVEAAVDDLEISTVSVPAAAPEPPVAAAAGLTLLRAVPNPAGESCRIDYVVPADGPLNLSLYAIDGRLERTLLQEAQSAGPHSVTLKVGGSGGIANGIYWLRLLTAVGERRERLVVLSGSGF